MLDIHETSLLRPTDDSVSRVIRITESPLMRANLRTRIDRSAEFCVHAAMAVATERPYEQNSGLLSVSRYGAMASREQYLTALTTLDANAPSARPKDFVQSILNLPGAQATIATELVGFFSHLVGGPYATILAFWHAERVLEMDGMDEIVVVAYEALTNELIDMLHCSHPKTRFAEGAAACRVSLTGREGSQPSPSGRILGFGFAAGKDAERKALGRALYGTSLTASSLEQVMVCNEPETFDPEVLLGPDPDIRVQNSTDKPNAFSVMPLWEIIDSLSQNAPSAILAPDGANSTAALILEGIPTPNQER